MVRQLEATALELGLPFGKRTKTYNSRLAQELGLWAEDQGRGENFHMGAFHSYFAEGLNIAEHSVLLDLAQQIGLDKNKAKQVLEQRSYRKKVDTDWSDSKKFGITAVPTMVMGKHKLVGNQKYEILQQLVAINKVEKKQI